MSVRYDSDIKYYGPFKVEGNLFFVIVSLGEYFIFHRETSLWIRITIINKNPNWENIIKEKYNHIDKIIKKKPYSDIPPLEQKYKPDCLMLFPSENCNCRCVYCHCNSSIGVDMPLQVAKTAIKYYVENYSENGKAHLAFMGGGEPTTNMSLIKKSTQIFRDYCAINQITSTISIVTNGCCSKNNAKWILNNLDFIRVSFDGLPTLQNKQRPLANGKESWPIVKRFFECVEEENMKVTARVTLSFDNISKIDDILSFTDNLPLKHLSIEAAYKTGRGKINDFGGKENYEVFFSELLKYFSKVQNSWLNPFIKTRVFCSAPRGNMIVTSQGNISLCTEISEKNDDIAEYGIVGKIKDNEVNFFQDRFIKFQDKVLELMKDCEKCVIKYKCAGGCFAKRWRGYDTDDPHLCDVVRKAHLSILLHLNRKHRSEHL